MSFDEALVFIKRVKEKTGRYPLIYANNEVTRAITEQYAADETFSQTRLWYARFRRAVTDFPKGVWKTYVLWQFSSEQNCSPANRSACLYTVPGTEYDMDVDVFNGTIDELRSKWPFDPVTVPRMVTTALSAPSGAKYLFYRTSGRVQTLNLRQERNNISPLTARDSRLDVSNYKHLASNRANAWAGRYPRGSVTMILLSTNLPYMITSGSFQN